MRHQKRKKSLGRTAAPRKHLIKSLCVSLAMKGSIITTLTKAKVVRPVFESYITLAKKGTLQARRLLIARLNVKMASYFMATLAPKYKDRKGGYTRITKLSIRRNGDGAERAHISLV